MIKLTEQLMFCSQLQTLTTTSKYLGKSTNNSTVLVANLRRLSCHFPAIPLLLFLPGHVADDEDADDDDGDSRQADVLLAQSFLPEKCI